jgi:hypothetical protein
MRDDVHMRHDVLPFDVSPGQRALFPEVAGDSAGTPDDATRVLDELVHDARMYRSGRALRELLEFAGRFRFYSPFNAMLVRTQLEGATFVAPARRWRERYGRAVRPEARPIVILRPRGPVMVVFDVSDTVGIDGEALPLPPEVVRPFEISRLPDIEAVFARTERNALRDGVRVTRSETGSQQAGRIQRASGPPLQLNLGRGNAAEVVLVPQRYVACLNADHDPSTQYATLVHELAHLYCGHLGTPDERWWPSRTRLDHPTQEFEAEAASFIVCKRTDDNVRFPPYLAGVLGEHDLPPFSLDRVVKVAGDIERMGRQNLPPRRERPRARTH